jgi:hypothetical protein
MRIKHGTQELTLRSIIGRIVIESGCRIEWRDWKIEITPIGQQFPSVYVNKPIQSFGGKWSRATIGWSTGAPRDEKEVSKLIRQLTIARTLCADLNREFERDMKNGAISNKRRASSHKRLAGARVIEVRNGSR